MWKKGLLVCCNIVFLYPIQLASGWWLGSQWMKLKLLTYECFSSCRTKLKLGRKKTALIAGKVLCAWVRSACELRVNLLFFCIRQNKRSKRKGDLFRNWCLFNCLNEGFAVRKIALSHKALLAAVFEAAKLLERAWSPLFLKLKTALIVGNDGCMGLVGFVGLWKNSRNRGEWRGLTLPAVGKPDPLPRKGRFGGIAHRI